VSIAARKIRLIMRLRQGGISDTGVLSAIERIPREAFVPPSFQDRAYDDCTLPIGQGQTLSQPRIVAQMTQALETDRRLKVLEIGTGSGYQAAILSRLCRRVYTVERYRALLEEAEQRFRELRLHNITTLVGDGCHGWPKQAPFARIIVTAASSGVPGALVDQLADRGLMVLPVGRPGMEQTLLRLHRDGDSVREEALGEVRFIPLVSGAVALPGGLIRAAGPERAGLA